MQLGCHTLLLRDAALSLSVVGILTLVVSVSGLLSSGLARYVGLESHGLAVGEGLLAMLSAGGGAGIEALAMGLWLWALAVVCFLVIHVVAPGAVLGLLPFSLSFWAWCGGAVLLLTPLVSIGYRGVVQLVSLAAHGLWEGALGSISDHEFGTLAAVGSGSSGALPFVWADLACLGMPLRSLWSLGNWLYQCAYFAVRMWLVFVLHAFCVASFCVLWSLVGGSWLPIFALPLGGFLGLSLGLGLMALLYLGIQTFVYVSFSVSFAFYCAAGFYGHTSFTPRLSANTLSANTLTPASAEHLTPELC